MKNTRQQKSIKQLTDAEIRAALALPNGADALYASTDAETTVPRVFAMLSTDCAVPAAAYLYRAAKTKRQRDRINSLFNKTNREQLRYMLVSEDAKLRKNAARLSGALMDARDVEMLQDALSRENTLFVIPSIILALGSLSAESMAARAALSGYTPPDAAAEQARLIRDIHEALSTARDKFIKHERHPFMGLGREHDIELRCPHGLSGALVYELNSTPDITILSRDADSVLVRTGDYNALFRLRMFTEALFPIPDADGQADFHETAKQARVMLDRLAECHSGKPPFTYRVDTRLPNTDRRAVARVFSEILDADGEYKNTASDYELELRILPHAMYVKLYTVPDTRFSYRLADVPASIDPVTAASLLGAVRDVMGFSSGARVLDICCGSGTMLIERERLYAAGKPSALIGLDISPRAIAAAVQNADAADSAAKFIHTDCLKYSVKPHERYHEIIANLPFGNRVGNHANNRRLYEGIVRKLPEWLLPDGTALLYTADKKLLHGIIRQNEPTVKLVREIRTRSGGLQPSGFVVKVL